MSWRDRRRRRGARLTAQRVGLAGQHRWRPRRRAGGGATRAAGRDVARWSPFAVGDTFTATFAGLGSVTRRPRQEESPTPEGDRRHRRTRQHRHRPDVQAAAPQRARSSRASWSASTLPPTAWPARAAGPRGERRGRRLAATSGSPARHRVRGDRAPRRTTPTRRATPRRASSPSTSPPPLSARTCARR